VCGRVSEGASERATCEAVRVKPKLQWILQDIGDARNVEHLPRKTTGDK
jgi:hypothetical protein